MKIFIASMLIVLGSQTAFAKVGCAGDNTQISCKNCTKAACNNGCKWSQPPGSIAPGHCTDDFTIGSEITPTSEVVPKQKVKVRK